MYLAAPSLPLFQQNLTAGPARHESGADISVTRAADASYFCADGHVDDAMRFAIRESLCQRF